MPYVAPSPYDYDAQRRALVQAVALATGLPPSQIIMLEAEVRGFPRPKAPYVGIMVTVAGVKLGYDWVVPVVDNPGMPTGLHTYAGPRAVSVSFEAYGRSHEEAYSIMAAFQSALEYPPVESLLDAAGLAVWDIGSVSDISAELSTTYEGRAHLDVTFGTVASTTLDLGRIDAIPITGQVASDGALSVNVGPLTVTRN